MERVTTLKRAKQIFGKNFIGMEELMKISTELGINISAEVKDNNPQINYTEDFLLNLKDDFFLILAIPCYKDRTPLTIVKMRDHFGWNPDVSEPCFYNQDWYVKETFANTCNIEFKWYLLRKSLIEESRGYSPDNIHDVIEEPQTLPTALLTVYCFFANYLLNPDDILWKNDYIWCSDYDHNNDRIYTARYFDTEKINKNGFSIHRHLSIKKNYGIINLK